jgi:hypothetical protein
MAAAQYWPRTRWRQVLLVLSVFVVALSFVIAFLLEEPLRRRIEAGVNASLVGYKVRIERLDLHLLNLSLDLENTIVVQEENPEPPMAEIPTLSAGIHWSSVFRGRLVADFEFDDPRLFVDARQGKKEIADETPVAERGWQQAAYEIYPLKINEFKINNGTITYTPDGDFKPLEMSRVNLVATNIRNIRSRDHEYPSDLHLDAVVFKDATLGIDGHADFLAEPHLGMKTNVDISKLPLSYFTGLIHDYAVIRKGTLSGTGMVEYAPKIKQVSLEDVAITGADGDYVITAANEAESKNLKAKTIKEAKQVSNDPGVVLRAKSVRMTESTFGWVDRRADPDFRVFLAGLDVSVKGFSNQKSEGAGVVDAKGMLNGTGPSSLHVVFRPQTKSPDFDLAVRVNDADLRSLNDVLRAKANVDVVKGKMGYFSELTVRNNHVDGYVKVLFSDIDVYDSQQDKQKPFIRKAYEAIADGVAEVLENRKTEDTATKASISGPLENPNASIIEIFVRLVQNAFFKAILPGLDQEVAKLGKDTGLKVEEQKTADKGDGDREKRSDGAADDKPRRKSLFGDRDKDDEAPKEADQRKNDVVGDVKKKS